MRRLAVQIGSAVASQLQDNDDDEDGGSGDDDDDDSDDSAEGEGGSLSAMMEASVAPLASQMAAAMPQVCHRP